MAVDSSQVEYRYISQRQVREIVAQHAAARATRGWEVNCDVDLRFAKVSFSAKEADFDNIYDLANRSEPALEGNVHRLDVLDPNPIPDGAYLRLTMPLQECVIQPFDDVVAYVGITRLPRLGTVLVGLIGSASNLAGAPTEARVVPYSGRHASHQIGFEEFIRSAIAESGAPDTRSEARLSRPLDREELIEDAINSLAGSRIRALAEQLDALVRVHVAARTENQFVLDDPLDPISQIRVSRFGEVREHLRPDYVILGSPVWLRTPEPKVFNPTTARFEQIVTACGEVMSGLRQSTKLHDWPPTDAWSPWCNWCAAELSASAADPSPFQVIREPGRWARLRGNYDPVIRTHGEAWFIGGGGRGRGGFALTMSGGVYAGATTSDTDEENVVECYEPVHEVEPHSEALPEAADQLLFAVLAARTPLSQSGYWTFEVKDGSFCRVRH